MPYSGVFSGGTVVSPITAGDGSVTAPSYGFSSDSTSGMYRPGGGQVGFAASGTGIAMVGVNGLTLGALTYFSGSGFGQADTALSRAAAGVWRTTDASAGTTSWLQQTAGYGALNADYTNATTTFSNTNLSRTVISGRTYSFQVSLFITQATAASGVKIDFNGGTATATNFVVNAWLMNETGGLTALAAASSTTLAGVINATTTVTTGQQNFVFNGSFVPSASGTFILRAADNSGVTTLTIKRGSWILMNDVPAL